MDQSKKNIELLSKIIGSRSSIDFGLPPWPEDKLKAAYFQNFQQTRKAIQVHLGFSLLGYLEDIQIAKELFGDAVSSLEKACGRFRQAADTEEFWWRSRRIQFEERVREIRLALFSATTAAMALRDAYRRIQKKSPLADYDMKREEIFGASSQVAIVEGLRNYLSHRRNVEAHWEVSMTFHPHFARFVLRQDELLDWDAWGALAQDYILANPEEIDIERIFADYKRRVEEFYSWFYSAFSRKGEPQLSEYRAYKQMLDRWASRSNWNILLDQFLLAKVDPYAYLNQYLTEAELKEVLSCLPRSPQQVNMIIEILDVFRACDEELRRKVFSLFGVVEG
jgi:hypothetical protein